MAKNWSRNQKLILWGLIISFIAGVGSWVKKIEIKVNRIESEVKRLIARTAEIGTLTAGTAGIGTSAPSKGLSVSGNLTLDGDFYKTKTDTNPSSITLYGETYDIGWQIAVAGTNLQFNYLQKGQFMPFSTLTPTGFVRKTN